MPDVYEIRVRGHLTASWSNWFEGLQISNQTNGEAVLTVPLADQAALHGLLARVRDLGLPLISVTQASAHEPAPEETS